MARKRYRTYSIYTIRYTSSVLVFNLYLEEFVTSDFTLVDKVN